MSHIEDNYSGISVSIDFVRGINLLFDDSGTGKTFLFKILKAYLRKKGIPYAYINYDWADWSTDRIKNAISDKEYIFMDNTSLYMNSDLFDYLKKLDAYIFVVTKSVVDMDTIGTNICYVNFDNDFICLRKII